MIIFPKERPDIFAKEITEKQWQSLYEGRWITLKDGWRLKANVVWISLHPPEDHKLYGEKTFGYENFSAYSSRGHRDWMAGMSLMLFSRDVLIRKAKRYYDDGGGTLHCMHMSRSY